MPIPQFKTLRLEQRTHGRPMAVGFWNPGRRGSLPMLVRGCGPDPGGETMPRYRVRFMKTISDATGHEFQMCQRELSCEAQSREDAIAQATADFSRAEGVHDWNLRADSVEVEKIETE